MINQEWIHRQLTAGARKIYQVQERVASTEFQARSGRLRQHLQSCPFSEQTDVGLVKLNMRILPYLRLLDIGQRERKSRIEKHRRAKKAIYNRVVWGVLYHETFPTIQYGLSEDIRAGIRYDLERAVKPNN